MGVTMGMEEILREHFRQRPEGARRLVERFEGIGDEHLEAAYAIGKGLYERGKYGEAEQIFYFLATMDHYEPRYWKALGRALECGRKYREAVGVYLGAYFLNPMDMEVVWSMGECSVKLGEREGAMEFFGQVWAIYEETGEGKELAHRAKEKLAMMGKKKEGK
jgi:type III secretion system low calcium response chaperone LcrH/SycD